MANHNTRFYYGPGRNRYKRLDTDTADGTGGITTTHYVGSVEIIKKPNGSWEKKRYIGGVLVITLNSDGSGAKEYLFTDHLGSTDVIAHRFGNVLQQMSFDAFGSRRNPTASNAPTPWGTLPILQQLNFDTTHTTHGYTGHQGADKVGLIHMTWIAGSNPEQPKGWPAGRGPGMARVAGGCTTRCSAASSRPTASSRTRSIRSR